MKKIFFMCRILLSFESCVGVTLRDFEEIWFIKDFFDEFSYFLYLKLKNFVKIWSKSQNILQKSSLFSLKVIINDKNSSKLTVHIDDSPPDFPVLMPMILSSDVNWVHDAGERKATDWLVKTWKIQKYSKFSWWLLEKIKNKTRSL